MGSDSDVSSLSDSEEYIVEAIRDWRFNLDSNQKEYLIKWHNYDESENTWEPEENLHCPEVLKSFKSSLTGEDKKCFETEDPTKLTGFQRHATFQRCVGADGPYEADGNTELQDNQKFYCLITFEDSDLAEEVTLKEFWQYKPEEAFRFVEERLFKAGPRQANRD